jgi:hypothetical protein
MPKCRKLGLKPRLRHSAISSTNVVISSLIRDYDIWDLLYTSDSDISDTNVVISALNRDYDIWVYLYTNESNISNTNVVISSLSRDYDICDLLYTSENTKNRQNWLKMLYFRFTSTVKGSNLA